jgi:hypothetical protein
MRIIQTTLALILAVSLLPLPCPAADGASVHALLISASNQKGGSDPKLATHESTLRRNLPFDTFRLTGEGSASVAAGGRASLSLGRGHRLELQSEKGGGPGIRLKVEWLNGDKTVMSTSLTLQPGVPAVLGRRGGDEGEVPVVLVIAK